MPTISYIEMASAATGWLGIAAVSVFGFTASLIAALAGLRVFSRFFSYR